MGIYDINGTELTPKIEGFADIRKNGFLKSIAHRGYSATAPENTIPAFRLAKVNDFDAVEMDIKWTQDTIPIILHDASIARTARNTDGSAIESSIADANVSNLPLSTLEQYDYGIWKSSDYAGTTLPTFEQAIAFCKNVQLHPYIEVGQEGTNKCSILVSIVRNAGMLRNVTWCSKWTTALLNIQRLDRFARLDYFVTALNESEIQTARTLVNGYSPVVIGTGLNDSDTIIKSALSYGFEIECGLIANNSQALAINTAMVGAMSNGINTREVIYNHNIE